MRLTIAWFKFRPVKAIRRQKQSALQDLAILRQRGAQTSTIRRA
jgi:hypothetical protein